ncbi:MAG: hypothetical protein ACK4TG_01855 [Thermaurantiacus sp.]
MTNIRIEILGLQPGFTSEIRVLADRPRLSDQELLKLDPVLNRTVAPKDRLEFQRDRIRIDGPILFLLVARADGDSEPSIVARQRFGSAAAIPDTVLLRADESGPQPEPGPAPLPKPVRLARAHRPLHQALADQEALASRISAPVRTMSIQRLRDRQARLQAGKEQADILLSPKGLRGRARRTFADPGTDSSRLARRVRADGLKGLADGLARRHGILLRDIRPEEPSDTTNLPLSALRTRLQINLSEVQRPQRNPIETCAARHRAQRLARRNRASEDFSPSDEHDQPAGASGFEDAVRRIVAGTALEDRFVGRPGHPDIEASLGHSLATGPADSPMVHNISVLHVAWEDVWTAAIDSVTRDKVAELYAELVQLVDYAPPPVRENGEVRELKELLAELSDLVRGVSADLSSPSALMDWLGEDLRDVWPHMSSYEQQKMLYFHHVDEFAAVNGRIAGALKETTGPKFTLEALLQTLDVASFSLIPMTGDIWKLSYRPYIDNPAYLSDMPDFAGYDRSWIYSQTIGHLARHATARKDAILLKNSARTALRSGTSVSSLGRAEALIAELQDRARQPYHFDVFAPDTYNFGLLTTYRQTWVPLAYQAGDLAGTIPLAPGETRTYDVKRTATQTERRSETSGSTGIRTDETGGTLRAEAEIVRRTNQAMKQGVDTSVGGSFGGKIAGVGAKTDFKFGGDMSADMGSDSASTKREFREQTQRMVQEYRAEHQVEISLERSTSEERQDTRQISNTNNEISVTYLFYELQRCFEVSARLQAATPVILVAFDVPSPDQISEAWLLEHAWIIRGVLLDRDLAPVLGELSESFAGDEVAVEVLEAQWKTQLAIVSELRRQLSGFTDLRDAARQAVERAAREVRASPAPTPASSTAPMPLTIEAAVAAALFERGGTQSGMGEALGSERDSARQALDWADADRSDAETALRESIGALERATSIYIDAVRQRLNRRTRIDQLILHVKANILHYMQAIWRREVADQRYLRLYDLEIQWPGEGKVALRPVMPSRRPGGTGSNVDLLPPGAHTLPSPGHAPAKSPLIDRLGFPPVQDDLASSLGAAFEAMVNVPEFAETRKLHQVADLDRILGFRGNYAAFRLKEPNALSIHMMQDFLDSYFGLRDPDPFGNLPTAEEALHLAECAWNQPDITDEDQADIARWLADALEMANEVSDIVTVPTGELFIEALPGTHPVLEDFKLRHRAADAAKAEAEARSAAIETLRRARRLMDGDTASPSVDRLIKVEGANPTISIDSD